jgi:hypothetical protein
VEGVLIVLFMINAYIFSKRMTNGLKRRDNVIDVEGEVIRDREKLK